MCLAGLRGHPLPQALVRALELEPCTVAGSGGWFGFVPKVTANVGTLGTSQAAILPTHKAPLSMRSALLVS
jgi:hypothetical protein